jgi:hypothetical protein
MQLVKGYLVESHGVLQTLKTPLATWTLRSLDFNIDLSIPKSFVLVLLIVDWFIKMAHFIPCSNDCIGKQTKRLWLNNVYHYHGLPYGTTLK